MLKKLLLSILIISIALFSGYGVVRSVIGEAEKNEEFFIEDYNIMVTTPSGWEGDFDTNFDLQCLSPKGDTYLSVFAYTYLDYSEDETPIEFFKKQNDGVLLKRDNVVTIEEISKTEFDNRVIYSSLHSAERDGTKNYYNSYLIDFYYDERLVWVLCTGMPSVIDREQTNLEQIITDITVVSE